MRLSTINSAKNLSKADALILDIIKADDVSTLEEAVKAKEGPIAGARLKTSSAGTVKKALNSGCDFLVFAPDAPVSLTRDDQIGKVIEMESGFSDILLRTAGDLPVDAVIAVEKEAGEILTIKRLMDLQRMIYLVKPPLLVKVPLSFSVEELQVLCDMGIKGVLVEVEEVKTAEKLADLRKAIESLKKPSPRKKDKMCPTVPSLKAEAAPVQEEEEEEEE